MITYIKQSVPGFYFELENELDPNLYVDIGLTYKDFLDGLFVKLSDKQVLFHVENPTATIKEVFDLALREETLLEVQLNKLLEIEMYDSSSAVNEFYYNGLHFWIDKATRVGLMNSTTILKNSGEKNTTLWLGNVNVTLPCDLVIQILSLLEVYALLCYNITALHKNTINEMDNIEDIKNFDITLDYPEKLKFDNYVFEKTINE